MSPARPVPYPDPRRWRRGSSCARIWLEDSMFAVGAERKFKLEPGAGRGITRQSSAERLYPLAHPAHSVAFELKAAAAVVFNLQNTISIIQLEPQAAVLSLRVAYNVGHGFAHDQRDHAFLGIGQWHVRSFRL